MEDVTQIRVWGIITLTARVRAYFIEKLRKYMDRHSDEYREWQAIER